MLLKDILFTQGFGTRYDCEQMVLNQAIKINGEVVDDPDADFDTQDLVLEWRDSFWPVCDKALIAMNKPAGYECSNKPRFNPTVMSMLPGPLIKRGVQCVGRLDVDTTGLLLLTDDGPLLHRLTHPKRHVSKVYKVTCKHPITDKLVKQLLDGVLLADENETIKAQAVEVIDETTLLMTLTQGKYHQVKRMIAACSNRVEALHRVQVGKFVLPENLQPGQWIWINKSDVL